MPATHRARFAVVVPGVDRLASGDQKKRRRLWARMDYVRHAHDFGCVNAQPPSCIGVTLMHDDGMGLEHSDRMAPALGRGHFRAVCRGITRHGRKPTPDVAAYRPNAGGVGCWYRNGPRRRYGPRAAAHGTHTRTPSRCTTHASPYRTPPTRHHGASPPPPRRRRRIHRRILGKRVVMVRATRVARHTRRPQVVEGVAAPLAPRFDMVGRGGDIPTAHPTHRAHEG